MNNPIYDIFLFLFYFLGFVWQANKPTQQLIMKELWINGNETERKCQGIGADVEYSLIPPKSLYVEHGLWAQLDLTKKVT